MIRLSSDQVWFFAFVFVFVVTSCEKPITGDGSVHADDDGNLVLLMTVDGMDVQKLNVHLFDSLGNKVFDKVRTQTTGDAGFGRLALSVPDGRYTVVAVGHSSKISATIKSPTMVQFTASDGEKLTDTFVGYGTVTVSGNSSSEYPLTMQRATALFRIVMTDSIIPSEFTRLRVEYKGASANVNPQTLEGCTKSTQTETRLRSDTGVYDFYTFPYMSDHGELTVTATALDGSDGEVWKRTFEHVPVSRNRITTYRGAFFSGESVVHTGFTVDGWLGEDVYYF